MVSLSEFQMTWNDLDKNYANTNAIKRSHAAQCFCNQHFLICESWAKYLSRILLLSSVTGKNCRLQKFPRLWIIIVRSRQNLLQVEPHCGTVTRNPVLLMQKGILPNYSLRFTKCIHRYARSDRKEFAYVIGFTLGCGYKKSHREY